MRDLGSGSHNLHSLRSETKRFRHNSRGKILPGISQKNENFFEIHTRLLSWISQSSKFSPCLAEGIANTIIREGLGISPVHFLFVKILLLTAFVDGIPQEPRKKETSREHGTQQTEQRQKTLVPGKKVFHPSSGEIHFM
jgi:hypothetical protein